MMNISYLTRAFLATGIMATVCLSSCKKEEVDPVISVDRVKYYTGHEYVDLGLSVLWAATNVGADSAHKCGDFYAWREVKSKDVFSLESYEYKASHNETDTMVDAARAQWRGLWRMPDVNECKELIKECKWEWIDSLGSNGYKVTGKTGNCIFLPAAGLQDGNDVAAFGECGNYWTSTFMSMSTEVSSSMYIHQDTMNLRYDYRYRGLSIRPVARNLYKELGVEDTFTNKPSSSEE